MPDEKELTDADYSALADFRYALREFQAFSERNVAEYGLTPQQHQALLTTRAAARAVSVGYIAERLIIRPHSASGMVVRLEALGLVTRHVSSADRRQSLVALTPQARALLRRLSAIHREEIVRLRPLLKTLLDTFL